MESNLFSFQNEEAPEQLRVIHTEQDTAFEESQQADHEKDFFLIAEYGTY